MVAIQKNSKLLKQNKKKNSLPLDNNWLSALTNEENDAK